MAQTQALKEEIQRELADAFLKRHSAAEITPGRLLGIEVDLVSYSEQENVLWLCEITTSAFRSVLAEALSAGIAKAGAVGLMVRISQWRTRIVQDRTGSSAQRNLAEMVFLAASMVALNIGTISRDSELVNRAKSVGCR